MARGYGIPYHLRATQDNFDGSATAKTLWIKSAFICNISVSVGLNTDETVVGRQYLVAKLEAFTGAKASATVWSGGAWTELWAGHFVLYAGATATKDSNTPQVYQTNFDAPLKTGVDSLVQEPPFASNANQFQFPNTHAAAEVAGETDVRLYVTSIAGNITLSHIDIAATVTGLE